MTNSNRAPAGVIQGFMSLICLMRSISTMTCCRSLNFGVFASLMFVVPQYCAALTDNLEGVIQGFRWLICVMRSISRMTCCRSFNFGVFALLMFLVPHCAAARTDNLEVKALQDLYVSFNSPPQLKGWKSGGDPCAESWTGVSCSGSSITQIKLDNKNISGTLGYQLNNLLRLKQLDVSNNNIYGEIPYNLPSNLTHLNLACNNLSQNIPYSISSMKNIRQMNLSHNYLSGPIGNAFTGLLYLKEMDLSYNQFIGDLPRSFGTLKGLSRLFLQHNEFTGSVIYLAGLQLTDLNIEDNHFTGTLPKEFESIHNLRIGGNVFGKGDFRLHNPRDQHIFPPSMESNAVETVMHKTNTFKICIILVGFGTLVAACSMVLICFCMTGKTEEGKGKRALTGPDSTSERKRKKSNPDVLKISDEEANRGPNTVFVDEAKDSGKDTIETKTTNKELATPKQKAQPSKNAQSSSTPKKSTPKKVETNTEDKPRKSTKYDKGVLKYLDIEVPTPRR